jgi:hypothetical protein
MRTELRTGDVTGATTADPRAHDAGSLWSQRVRDMTVQLLKGLDHQLLGVDYQLC